MNYDNYNIQTEQSNGPAGQISIMARSIFPYVISSQLQFTEWEKLLRKMENDISAILRDYRVFECKDGELAINVKLAMQYIIREGYSPNAAIAAVLIDEALTEETGQHARCIDNMLLKYWKLGIIQGFVQARTLHDFLCCETPFDLWFSLQKKNLRLRYGYDFVRVRYSNQVYAQFHKRDMGQGEIYLSFDAARCVIKATPTPRGKKTTEYLDNPIMQM